MISMYNRYHTTSSYPEPESRCKDATFFIELDKLKGPLNQILILRDYTKNDHFILGVNRSFCMDKW